MKTPTIHNFDQVTPIHIVRAECTDLWREEFTGALVDAIARAIKINAEYQPSFGVQVEDESGETLWDSEETANQYRFENGSLYRYDADSNAYVHCFSSPYAETEEDAIRMYEESQEQT